MKKMLSAALLPLGAMATCQGAHAQSVSGYFSNGLRYEAQSTIVGTTSTASRAAGGDSRYFATAPKYSGVVALIMQSATGASLCSGALLADRMSILTAGHCVSGGYGSINPIKTTAYFYNGGDPDAVTYLSSESTPITVKDYFVESGYTGQVIDQNDIAVLRLSSKAPAFATSYGLYTDDLTTQDFNVAGFGRRSTGGGAIGSDAVSGRLRQGDNRYEFRLGDPELQARILSGGSAKTDNVYLADFDSGNSLNDSACLLSTALGAASARFCDAGRGASEASIAPGDSGGPGFIDGQIASISSFIVSFGTSYGDVDGSLNSSFGELGGYVPTSIHAQWINSLLAVPEPDQWLTMLFGFGLVGAVLRRRGLQPGIATA